MNVVIACIVEGHGDVEAVPIVVRRIAEKIDPTIVVNIPRPIRVSRTKIVEVAELDRAIELAVRTIDHAGGILIIQDSDDDCPAALGPKLHDMAVRIRCDVPIGVVLAKFEFESWFLAAAESIGGRRGLPNTLSSPCAPETIRGAKEWLSHRMEHKYVETLDQPALAALFDLQVARRADSFDKCYREVERLLCSLKARASEA